MQSMIFAAGLGTRLKPITDSLPKALVEVGGKTLLERTINTLRNAGSDRIVVNVHHFAEKIMDYLERNGNFGLDILISDEREKLLNTGGGIKKAAGLFKTDEDILIHNVDILSNVDLRTFYNGDANADALLFVSQRVTKRYLLFNDDMQLVGWTNVETGEVRSPHAGLDVARCHKYAFAGIHRFSPRLFNLMQGWPDQFGITDFYVNSCDKASIKAYVKEDLKVLDVGKIDTLNQAEQDVKAWNL